MLVSRRTRNCLLDTVPARIPEITTVETRKLGGNPSMHPRSSFSAVILRADDSRQRYPWYRFVVSSTLKGNEKIGEKMETTLLEVPRKILSIIGVTQRNDAYIRNRKNIHDYSFQSTTFRSRHSSSKNHHFPLHSNSQRRARTCLQVNRQHTRSSDNLPTKIRQLASIVRFRMPLDLDQSCTLRNRRTVDT